MCLFPIDEEQEAISDMSVAEPALGEAAAEPAQNQSGSRQNRRAVRMAIPFTDDHAGGMETLFSDPTLGDAQVYSITSPGFRNQQILLTYARCECPFVICVGTDPMPQTNERYSWRGGVP